MQSVLCFIKVNFRRSRRKSARMSFLLYVREEECGNAALPASFGCSEAVMCAVPLMRAFLCCYKFLRVKEMVHGAVATASLYECAGSYGFGDIFFCRFHSLFHIQSPCQQRGDCA